MSTEFDVIEYAPRPAMNYEPKPPSLWRGSDGHQIFAYWSGDSLENLVIVTSQNIRHVVLSCICLHVLISSLINVIRFCNEMNNDWVTLIKSGHMHKKMTRSIWIHAQKYIDIKICQFKLDDNRGRTTWHWHDHRQHRALLETCYIMEWKVKLFDTYTWLITSLDNVKLVTSSLLGAALLVKGPSCETRYRSSS